MANLTDESPMPFGKYKGDKMINVPASYLLWCKDNTFNSDVKEYVRDNYDALTMELK